MAVDTGSGGSPGPDDTARLKDALRVVPRGAFALAAASLALLLIAWFLIYLLVFVPRGVVG